MATGDAVCRDHFCSGSDLGSEVLQRRCRRYICHAEALVDITMFSMLILRQRLKRQLRQTKSRGTAESCFQDSSSRHQQFDRFYHYTPLDRRTLLTLIGWQYCCEDHRQPGRRPKAESRRCSNQPINAHYRSTVGLGMYALGGFVNLIGFVKDVSSSPLSIYRSSSSFCF